MPVLAIIKITTPAQLDTLATQTYLSAIVMAAIFIFFAVVAAYSIKFEGGQYPKDPAKRRLWFWALLMACFTVFFLYNMFFVAPTIKPSLQGKFLKINIISLLVSLGTYLILGFMLSKMFSRGKLGNWFQSKK